MSTSLHERFDTSPDIRSLFDTAGLRMLDMATVDPDALAGPLVVVRLNDPDDASRAAIVVTSATAEPEAVDALVEAAKLNDTGLEAQPQESSPDMNSLRDASGTPLTDIGIAIGTSASETDVLIGMILMPDDRRNEASVTPATPPMASGGAPFGAMTMLRDVLLDVTVELGRATMPLVDLMSLDVGSLVELDRPTGSPVDIRVNGILLGRGEVVVVDNEYAVRVVEVLDPAAESL